MVGELKLKTKLICAFVLASLIPLGIVSYIAMYNASKSLHKEAVAKFTAVQETKRKHLEAYFKSMRATMKIIRSDPYLHSSFVLFNSNFESNNNSVENDFYQFVVESKEASIMGLAEDNGFSDLLFISDSGNIIYSTSKGSDLGKNILDSGLSESNLGKSYLALQDMQPGEIVISDFEPYAPSNGTAASFMTAGMYDEKNIFIGFVAVRLSVDQVNSIVQQRSGMGETGESFLVGKLDGNTGLRSDRLLQDGRVGDSFSGKYIDHAIAGKSGSAIMTGGDGKKEFVRYDPVEVQGLQWGLITTASADEVLRSVHTLRNTIFGFVLVVVSVVITLAIVMTAVIVKPIKVTAAMLRDIAEGEGDLTKRLTIGAKDEIGEMAFWFNTFMEKLQGIVGQITGDAATLNHASVRLSDIAGKMEDGVGEISHRSEQVAGGTEEMSTNMNSVAAASEQASANVNMVSSATEEMTVTVNEIAQNSERARTVSESAVNKANETVGIINELGRSVDKIDKVTEVITEISEHTNLLALNATIEASRAGGAGKGFAVVANEIKELAKQTAAATLEIKTLIGGIQDATAESVAQIEVITGVINDVNMAVVTIATAVEEQAVTCNEIAGNVSQASIGINDVSVNVSQSSFAAKSVSDEISGFNVSVKEIARSSSEVSKNAQELSHLSEKLRTLVNRFKI